MPPLPVIPNVKRMALNWKDVTGRTAVNVMHINAGSVDAAAAFALLEGEVTFDMWGLTTTIMSVQSVSVTPLDGTSPTVEFATNPDGRWSGQAGGDPIPQMACVGSMKTAKRGRSYRGRIYMPFVSESVQNAGVLSNTAVNATQTAWDDFIADLGGGLVVASYRLHTAESVTSIKIEQMAATQRKRMTRLR